MSYVQENLMPNEKILFSARTSIAIFYRPLLVFGVAVILFLFDFFILYLPSQANPHSLDAVLKATLACIVFLLGLGIILESIVIGLQAIESMTTTEFAVTDKRVIAKTGFFRRRSLEIFLSKVESVSVHQTWLGRLLNAGTVMIIGTGGTRESFPAIDNPFDVRKIIINIIESHR